MAIGWNKNIKVQILQGGRPVGAESTPRYMLANPHGFRMEDLLKALCEATTELINESEARAESLKNINSILGDKKNEPSSPEVKEEVVEEAKRDDNSENIIYNPYEA